VLNRVVEISAICSDVLGFCATLKNASDLLGSLLVTSLQLAAYCRLLINGMPSGPFSLKTIEPTRVMPRRAAIVRKVSRQVYSKAAGTAV
jgi:hypothetical protein